MTVRVRLFAGLRHRAGAETVDLRLPDGATVEDAIKALNADGPLEGMLETMTVQMAVNREYAAAETELRAGDELALIPPVSGGEADRGGAGADATDAASQDARHAGATQDRAARAHVLITDRPLTAQPLIDAVRADAAGAIVVFEGVTRQVPLLRYEAYREMAEPLMLRIVTECVVKHGLQRAAVEHRIGDVPLGQPSVIVAVSAGHRQEAFAGAREIIDRVKERAPIWKQEISTDGSGQWIHD